MEMLVAIALFALVSAAVASALHRVGRSWEVGTRHIEQINEMRRTHELLRRWLTSARWVSSMVEGKRIDHFSGAADELRFAIEAPRHLPMSGWQRVGILLMDEDGRRILRLRYRPLFASRLQHDSSGEQVVDLASGLGSARFEYYGQTTQRGPKVWSEQWRQRQHLPELVRLRVSSSTGRDWPDLVIGLQSRGTIVLNSARTLLRSGGKQPDEYALQLPAADATSCTLPVADAMRCP